MGICYEGKTLKQAVDDKDRLFRETGHLYGLDKLELMENDPAKFMRFQLNLVAACVTAMETAKVITASPAGLMLGELLFMIANPEGEVISGSYGLIGHIQSPPYVIRHMAELGFEENPGIKDGDIFATNDMYYGIGHNSDHYTFVPIFYKGELIAWGVSMNHSLDSGGIMPGGWGAISFDTFTDGFLYPPMKTGENFQQYKWWELFWYRRTRTGLFNAMDDKMRVTGSLLLRDSVLKIVDEFGVDYARQAMREVLERERRLFLNRVKALSVPGKYGFMALGVVRYKGLASRLFPQSDKDWLLHYPAEFQVRPNGTMLFDIEGASSEDAFYCNCYEAGLKIGASIGTWTMFAHTATLNTALAYVLDWHIVPGSMFAPQNPFASAILGIGEACNYYTTFYLCLSRAYFARGFLEEAIEVAPDGSAYGMAGVMADGFRWASADMPLFGAGSTGAFPYRDGDVATYGGAHPQADLGEVENSEFSQPTHLNIGRKVVPNYCGHGKFRSGLAIAITQLITEPGQYLITGATAFPREVGCTTTGMSGGYPGPNPVIYFAHDTNMRELLSKGLGWPTDFVEAQKWIDEGKLKVGLVEIYNGNTPNVQLKDGDIFCQAGSAQGGWGDPLERDFDLLEQDIRYGWLTADVVRDVYGAVIDKNGKVNVAESHKLRNAMRNRRKERSVPAKDWLARERGKVLKKEFGEEVRGMYADCLKYDKFKHQFTDMWQLPEDYRLA